MSLPKNKINTAKIIKLDEGDFGANFPKDYFTPDYDSKYSSNIFGKEAMVFLARSILGAKISCDVGNVSQNPS